MNEKLCQFFTPIWVAEALVEKRFPRLDCADLVVEPTCGHGGFLKAVPPAVAAVGCEIDSVVAEVARAETGRPIITGDFRTVSLGVRPAVVIGNPPFVADVFDGILDRCHDLLPEGGRAGFILPVYFFQTARRVAGYADRWSITHDLLSRNAFHSRMRTPLTFAVFSKDLRRILVGFALYRETADVQSLSAPYRDALAQTRGSIWETVCRLALRGLGGEADLPTIYAEVEQNRPSRTQFWREKIRQTLRIYRDSFRAVATGRYALVGALHESHLDPATLALADCSPGHHRSHPASRCTPQR